MNEVNFELIDFSDTNKNIPQLSDSDIQNLKYYLNYSTINPINTQKNMSTDFYSNNEDSQQLTDIYQQHSHIQYTQEEPDIYQQHSHMQYTQEEPDIYQQHSHMQYTQEEPEPSTFVDNYTPYTVEFATCGMEKNRRLPVPCENFSLTDGCFGDDAGFTTERGHETFLGISDGAGGNLMYGFDPRLFSKSLMRNCSDLVYAENYSTSEPKRLLYHAFDRLQHENCFGSATACVLGIDCQTGRLHSVNIGDSGYAIIRQGYVIHRSQSQEKNGDCPRQLGFYPWTAALKKQGLNYTQILSNDAVCETFELELDDIIILSTDGLFDNVPNHIIENILSQSRSLEQAAKELVNRSVRFYVKPDDILVMMARLTDNNNSEYEQKKIDIYL